jgi:SAM-dependent methyltransferase
VPPTSPCVILVPVSGAIDPSCEESLRELEGHGYPVWRVRGYSAIDAARNQLATDALAQGFEELMWIDADVAFDAGDVDKLRRHDLPLVCGIYPKKSRRQLACAFLPQTRQLVFGVQGGLIEILYGGFGFILTRRSVYETMQRQLNLPVCNRRFQENMVPYFAPLVVGEGEQAWYLGEDYAFCERARCCGFRIMADTSLRLWHVGSYRYGWEDAGRGAQRFSDYTFHINDDTAPDAASPPLQQHPGDRMSSHADAELPMTLSARAPQQLFNRAEKAYAAGRHDEAVPLYHQLLTSQFLPGVQMYRLAMIANREKDFDDAWILHHQALELDPRLAAHITPSGSPHHHLVCRRQYDTEDVDHCPLCQSREQTPLMVVNCLPFNHYHASFDPVRRWVRCQACGHGFANPRPSAAALREAFSEPPPPHLLEWNYGTLTAVSEIVHRLWQHHPGGSLLDVGVGGGALASIAVDYGYQVCGLDLHSGYAERLRRLGVEFLLGDICSFDFDGRQFDIIVMGDVLEHVAQPRRALAQAAALLAPNGLLWLSTPDYEGGWTRMLGDADPMWLEGEHLQYFYQGSLRRLLTEQGLAVIDYRLSQRFKGCMEVLCTRTSPDR